MAARDAYVPSWKSHAYRIQHVGADGYWAANRRALWLGTLFFYLRCGRDRWLQPQWPGGWPREHWRIGVFTRTDRLASCGHNETQRRFHADAPKPAHQMAGLHCNHGNRNVRN